MVTQEAPHIGHLIKEELARQERTVTWLAKKTELFAAEYLSPLQMPMDSNGCPSKGL